MGKIHVISLGGSIIIPEAIDVAFLKGFRELIMDHVSRDNIDKGKGGKEKDNRIALLCGGGNINRQYVAAARAIVPQVIDTDLDWVGIMATRLNAELVRALFSEHANASVVCNPTEKISFEKGKNIIVAGGWLPGWSTDYDAVMLAHQLGSTTLINLSNIDYVYDKDPNSNPDAQPLPSLSWKELRELVGSVWKPRLSAPFDPIASKEAEKSGMTVIVARGTDLANLKNILEGKPFKGTTIS
ncbi:UMP kinase [Candidatus Woesearchaeota archaeon CG_4_10_14_0_8_um_filter_47_5]|nr:MAG: UMP kinase [Candidatus Woesearchaeota archaeon CG_4_10_14_0_8_um_filter_47_5]